MTGRRLRLLLPHANEKVEANPNHCYHDGHTGYVPPGASSSCSKGLQLSATVHTESGCALTSIKELIFSHNLVPMRRLLGWLNAVVHSLIKQLPFPTLRLDKTESTIISTCLVLVGSLTHNIKIKLAILPEFKDYMPGSIASNVLMYT